LAASHEWAPPDSVDPDYSMVQITSVETLPSSPIAATIVVWAAGTRTGTVVSR